MKNHKSLLVLAIALAIAPFAQAWDSPEVGLVLDKTTTGFQVDRYDMSTGLSLGSFATNNISYVSALSIQEVGNVTHVFVKDQSGDISDKVYNMSTGQFLTSHIIGSNSTFGTVNSVKWIPGTTGNGAYLVQADSGGSWYQYDTDFSYVNAIIDGQGATMGQLSFDQGTSTMAYSVDNGTVDTVYYETLNQSNQQVTTFGYNDSAPSSYFYQGVTYTTTHFSIALDGGQNPLNSGIASDLNFSSGQSQGSIFTYVPSTGAYSATGRDTGFTTSQQPEIDFAAFGHTQNLYDLSFGGGVAEMYSFNSRDPGLLTELGGFSISGLNNPLDFAVYAAPEPKAPLLILTPFVFGFVAYRRKR